MPVPDFIISVILFAVDKIKFSGTGFNTDNVKAMRQNSRKKLLSDIKSLGYREIPFDQLIKRASDSVKADGYRLKS